MTRRSARQANHANDVDLIVGWLPDLRDWLSTVGEVIQLDEDHPSTIDGYPTKANGAKSDGRGGRRTILVREDEHGPEELIEVKGAEGTAFQRMEPQSAARRDVVHSIARSMMLHRRELADALSQLRRDVERFHSLRSPADLADPYCEVAKEAGLPYDDQWAIHCRTTFAGYLRPPWPEERPVSRFVYDFTRQHRRLPFEQELREYLSKGVVRVHV
jgi:predicted DCC family thiol-disulfide oxidoreductase YuxK